MVTLSFAQNAAGSSYRRNEEGSRLTKSVPQLRAWANALRNAETREGADALNGQAIAAAYGITVSAPSDEDPLQVIEIIEAPAAAAVANADDRNALTTPLESATFRAARASKGAKVTKVASIITSRRTPEDKAFLELCEQYQRACGQKVIAITFGEEQAVITGVLPSRDEKAQLANTLTLLGVTEAQFNAHQDVVLTRPTAMPTKLVIFKE